MNDLQRADASGQRLRYSIDSSPAALMVEVERAIRTVRGLALTATA